MVYRTLMAYLQAGADNTGVLNVATNLAQRFDAHVIGVSACQPFSPIYEEGFAASDVVTEDRAEIKKELDAAAKEFRNALKGHSFEWRSTTTYGPLADYVADQARAADLVIIGKPTGGTFFDQTRCLKVGGLVMQSGRPVLFVPPSANDLDLHHVIAAWKDTREARRAISDALPLLKAAGRVTIYQACEAGEGVSAESLCQDVAGWLARHGVKSSGLVEEAPGSEIGALRRALSRESCNLLIAGAYGHNRLSEWVFGGMTQDLLLDPECCVLLSH